MNQNQEQNTYDYRLDHVEGALFEKAEVNGIEMVLRWNTEFNAYTLYFPAMDLKGHPMDSDEEVIEIGPDEHKAEQVLDFAKRLAQNESSVHELYRTVGAFSRSLELGTLESQALESRKKVRHLGDSKRDENEVAA